MKIAIVTDYLNVYGGAERTLESILEIYPEADVFTSLYDPSKFSESSPIRRRPVRSVFRRLNLFQRFNLLENPIRALVSFFPKHFTFLMPFFFEHLNLSDYDLIISLGTIWAKGVKTDPSRRGRAEAGPNRQKHIFYCLTPPRFLYGYPGETSKRNVWYYRPFTTLIDHWLRIWDYNSAQKPDEVVSISREVQRRVKKFYRRDSAVVYPPVSLRGFNPLRGLNPIGSGDGYFLIVSRLAAYKGIDVAIRACNELKLPLKIVGTGREEEKLKSMAGPAVEFLGFRSDEEINELYKGAQALIFPTPEEDFGMVPLEANAHGLPVIAHRSGGVLETLVEGQTAIFYNENTPDSLAQALHHYIVLKWSAEDCIKNARRFGKERFKKEFKEAVYSFDRQKNNSGGG